MGYSCPLCEGTGKILKTDSFSNEFQIPCIDCDGKGRLPDYPNINHRTIKAKRKKKNKQARKSRKLNRG